MNTVFLVYKDDWYSECNAKLVAIFYKIEDALKYCGDNKTLYYEEWPVE